MGATVGAHTRRSLAGILEHLLTEDVPCSEGSCPEFRGGGPQAVMQFHLCPSPFLYKAAHKQNLSNTAEDMWTCHSQCCNKNISICMRRYDAGSRSAEHQLK